jgi:hypothetical protein
VVKEHGEIAVILIDNNIFGTPKNRLKPGEDPRNVSRWEATNRLLNYIVDLLYRAQGIIPIRGWSAEELHENFIRQVTPELRKGKKLRSVVTVAHENTVANDLKVQKFLTDLQGEEIALETTLTEMINAVTDRAATLSIQARDLNKYILDLYAPFMHIFRCAVLIANYHSDRAIANIINTIRGVKEGEEGFVTPDEIPQLLIRNQIIRLLPAIRRIHHNKAREVYNAALKALQAL